MMGQPPTTLLLALLLLLGAPGAAAPRPNPNLKILSYYDTVFEDQKSLLTLAIAENALANQFRSVGVPSLAPLDNIATGVWKRRHAAEGGSVLLPGWEKLVESWVGHLQPSLDNGTTVGVFLGVSPTRGPPTPPRATPPHPTLFTFAVILICAQDEICCDISVSCWEGLLNPLAEKFRALLGRDKIIYINECGGAIAGR